MKAECMPTEYVVVDDDGVDREVIRRALRKIGYRNKIVEAENGIEALSILQGSADLRPLDKPYIVILDLNMPRMNGFEFLDQLRRNPKIRHTPVFVLSTSSSKSDVEKAYDKCVSGYIVKSHKNKTLVAAVTMMDRYRQIIEHVA